MDDLVAVVVVAAAAVAAATVISPIVVPPFLSSRRRSLSVVTPATLDSSAFSSPALRLSPSLGAGRGPGSTSAANLVHPRLLLWISPTSPTLLSLRVLSAQAPPKLVFD